MAGSYPAFYLSGFRPTSVLKGKLPNPTADLLIRKGLVVFQFVLSVGLLCSTFFIQQQLDYLGQKNLGFDKCRLVYHLDDEYYLELYEPKITSQDWKFIKLIMMNTYAVHPVVLKSGWYSKLFDRFQFINSSDESEVKNWINNLQNIDQMTFEHFDKFWYLSGFQDQFLWDYLCWNLGFDLHIIDKNFPTELVRTGFIKIKIYQVIRDLKWFYIYSPYVYTSGIFWDSEFTWFPPLYTKVYQDWQEPSHIK